MNPNGGRLRILIVAFPDSVHTARWISQLPTERFDIHLFPSVPWEDIHPAISGVTVWRIMFGKKNGDNTRRSPMLSAGALNAILGLRGFDRIMRSRLGKIVQRRAFRQVVRRIRPSVVHTMETQRAGYLVADSRLNTLRYPWVHSIWGVDLHYFHTAEEHLAQIRKMLRQVSALVVEGNRDRTLAGELGFRGPVFIMPSVGGGFDTALLAQFDSGIPPSQRKLILIKGYEGGERLASAVLSALPSIAASLAGFRVIVYSKSLLLDPLIERIRATSSISIEVWNHVGYERMLRAVGEARVSITNNLSDGVPNSMLEAMALGAFPVQSDTADTEDWIRSGINGILVAPRDTEAIASAIVRALHDNALVDGAAESNRRLVIDRLDRRVIAPQIESLYHQISERSLDHS